MSMQTDLDVSTSPAHASETVNSDDATLRAAGEHLGMAREHLADSVADALSAGKDAARLAKAEIDDKLEKLLDQGKDMLAQAEELIRSRPWATFGVAFGAGYLIARFTRRSST